MPSGMPGRLTQRCEQASASAVTAALVVLGMLSAAHAQTPEGTQAAPSIPVPPVTGAAELPRDLSPWGMYLTADPLVKGVLIALVRPR